MNEGNKVDLGSIQIHKNVLAEIVFNSLQNIQGAHLVPKDMSNLLGDVVGIKKYPGISIVVDKNNQVTINVVITIQYGINLLDMARQIQDTIRGELEKTVDIDVKDINVSIEGMDKKANDK